MNKREKLKEKLASILDVDDSILEDNHPINDSSLDSLSVLTLIAAIDEIYSVSISGTDVVNSGDFFSLVSIIEERSS